MSDPYRQAVQPASDDALTALVETGPVSRNAGMRALFEESQVTDRLLGFIASDDRRARDDQRARVFGEGYRNELAPEAANETYGVEGYLKFDKPVNAARAAEMHRQAELRRYREETASRADLSGAEAIGASIAGAATDPVMLPTWFIGGGASALRAMRVAPAATRLGNVGRGALVGTIDGITGGVAAEALNASARLGTGEDYSFTNDGIRNVLFGAAFGSVIGGAVGATASPARPRPRGAIPDLIASRAQAAGLNPADIIRIAELESGLNPNAKNPRSSAGGLFQFIDDTARGMGLRNRMDPAQATDAAVRLAQQNTSTLRRVLGRDPDGAELYLAHQQGAGGATEILRDPNRSAVDALRAAGVRDPLRSITLNGGRADMTAGEFAGIWRRKFGGGPSLDAVTPARPPRALAGLTENERVGAFAEAIEALADDAPVSLGALVARDGLSLLDEASAVPSINGRWLEADTAVTRRGAEVPVRFAVVELRDLKTSHDDDLFPVADYPGQLQPRDRTRAGSQAANFELERDLNPSLLMRDKAASGGAPIVSPDGVVESGNGRTIALRRSAQTGTEAWARYTAELERQGIDVSGFDRPVLVRMRSEPMTGADRAELARSLNEAPTEAFSPAEQARGDARRVDADLIGLIEGDDVFAAANRPFLRGFVQRVAPGDANALTDARGAISTAGRSRVQAALVQAAYGDDALTAALFETTDAGLRGVGQALADAAPAWAKMRAEAPAEMDLTPALTSAVALMREARAGRISMGELLETRLGQMGLFGGEAITPETEALIRLMYRDEALTKPRGSERIADALRTYARGAAQTPAGPDLFGATPDGKAFLDTLIQKYAGAEGEGRTGLAYAGGDEPLWSTRELSGAAAEPAGLDLRPAEPDGQRSGGTRQQPEGQRGAGDAGATDGIAERLKAAGVDGVTVAADEGHGPVLAGLEDRWDDAVEALTALKTGDAKGVLAHPAVGRIDVVWGREATTPQKSDGWGLAKILQKHPEVIADLPERLARMEVTKVLPDRINLASPDDRAAVRLDWDGEAKTWLVTAFAKDGKGGRPGDGTSVSAALDGPAPSPNRSARTDIGPSAPQAKATPQTRLAALIDADPELKALMADTQALAAEAGVTIEPSTGAADPSTVAEAIRAAAVCLASEFVA